MAIDKHELAKSLMLGNYLQDHRGRLCIVEELVKEKIEYDVKAYAIYGAVTTLPLSPIPITEQWLKDFGFEEKERRAREVMFQKEHNRIFYIFYLNAHLDCDNANCGILGVYSPEETIELPISKNDFLKKHFPGCLHNFAWNIKYVHQLMNVWHSATGHELKLKEK